MTAASAPRPPRVRLRYAQLLAMMLVLMIVSAAVQEAGGSRNWILVLWSVVLASAVFAVSGRRGGLIALLLAACAVVADWGGHLAQGAPYVLVSLPANEIRQLLRRTPRYQPRHLDASHLP